MMPSSHRYRDKAFTLIELLVVISIIALLIALLLPALQSAKRRVRVLTCMSQLQQVGIGLHVYVTDDTGGRYPGGPWSWVSTRVWDTTAPGGTDPDGRAIWYDITAGVPFPTLFCPFARLKGAHDPTSTHNPDDKWSKYYYKSSVSYEIAYSLYLTLRDLHLNDGEWDQRPGGLAQNFTHSGNPDITGDGIPNGPYRPGDSDALVVGDGSWSDPNQCDLSGHSERVCGATHSPSYGLGTGVDFIDGDYLFGDGHVVTRNSLEYKIIRTGVVVTTRY